MRCWFSCNVLVKAIRRPNSHKVSVVVEPIHLTLRYTLVLPLRRCGSWNCDERRHPPRFTLVWERHQPWWSLVITHHSASYHSIAQASKRAYAIILVCFFFYYYFGSFVVIHNLKLNISVSDCVPWFWFYINASILTLNQSCTHKARHPDLGSVVMSMLSHDLPHTHWPRVSTAVCGGFVNAALGL